MLSFLDRVKIKFRHWIMPQETLVKLAEPYGSILDIGCGLGVFLTELSGQGKQLNGIEISADSVKKAKGILAQKDIQDIEIIHYDGDLSKTGNWGGYDIIFLNDVLHHIPPNKQVNFLNEIYAKMRKGSRFVLKDINAASPLVIFNKVHDLVLNHQYPYERSMIQCQNWCQSMGFQIDAALLIRKLFYPHFILVMTKL